MPLTIKPKFISTDMTDDSELSAGLALKADKSVVDNLLSATNEPTGHVDRTKSTLSFNNSTRTLSIAPVSTSFEIYTQGIRQVISTTLTKQIPNTSGSYFFYITGAGVLDYSTTFNTDILRIYAYTAYVYWNATAGAAIVFGEERHGCVLDAYTHQYLHQSRGSQLISGASISYTLGSGSSNGDAQIGIGDLRVADEDIFVNITHAASPTNPFEQVLYPIAKIPVYYQSGTVWTKDTATDYPLKQGSARAQYNKLTGGTWSTVDASANGMFLASFIFATTNINEPVIAILGQTEYQYQADAEANFTWSNIQFSELPAQEMKLLYVLIYQTSSAFANTPKAAFTVISDLRFNDDRQASAYSLNAAHSALSGLLNDDHPQYHNDARAYSKTAADALLAAKQDVGDYITELTGDVIATGPGSATATLANSGVTAGTYDSVVVDAKGRVTSGSVSNYRYISTTIAATTSTTYAAVPDLTSVSLPVGIYKFYFYGLMQTAAVQTGAGVRVSNGTATLTTCFAKWDISQGLDGTAKNYQYDQLTSATNATSASVQTANSNFIVKGQGVFRVTVAGTVAIQTRTEVNASAASLQAASIFDIEKIG